MTKEDFRGENAPICGDTLIFRHSNHRDSIPRPVFIVSYRLFTLDGQALIVVNDDGDIFACVPEELSRP